MRLLLIDLLSDVSLAQMVGYFSNTSQQYFLTNMVPSNTAVSVICSSSCMVDDLRRGHCTSLNGTLYCIRSFTLLFWYGTMLILKTRIVNLSAILTLSLFFSSV